MVHFILQYLFLTFSSLKQEAKMIGYYNYTVILTYLGTLSGFAGIICIWNENLKMALLCLMISGVCDMFDGKIASTMERTRQEKSFGIQIDSLSDLVCFGVLPALIIFYCTSGKFIHVMVSAAYLLCTLIRLAWFNVDEEERQQNETEGRKTYLGLPVTSAALILPPLIGAGQLLNLSVSKTLPWVLLLISAAFLAPFHLKKPGRIGKIALLISGAAGFIIVMIGVTV